MQSKKFETVKQYEVDFNNSRLTAFFPISSVNTSTVLNNNGLSAFKIRVADQDIKWEQNKPAIIDASFEHEIWNPTVGARMMLVIDFKHPDIQPEDDFLDPKYWDIQNIDGQAMYTIRTDSS